MFQFKISGLTLKLGRKILRPESCLFYLGSPQIPAAHAKSVMDGRRARRKGGSGLTQPVQTGTESA